MALSILNGSIFRCFVGRKKGFMVHNTCPKTPKVIPKLLLPDFIIHFLGQSPTKTMPGLNPESLFQLHQMEIHDKYIQLDKGRFRLKPRKKNLCHAGPFFGVLLRTCHFGLHWYCPGNGALALGRKMGEVCESAKVLTLKRFSAFNRSVMCI